MLAFRQPPSGANASAALAATVTIGNTTTSSALVLQAGTGVITITGATVYGGVVAVTDKAAGKIRQLAERAPVLVREHLHEPGLRGIPVVEQLQRQRAAGEAQVTFHQFAHHHGVGLNRSRFVADALGVAPPPGSRDRSITLSPNRPFSSRGCLLSSQSPPAVSGAPHVKNVTDPSARAKYAPPGWWLPRA